MTKGDATARVQSSKGSIGRAACGLHFYPRLDPANASFVRGAARAALRLVPAGFERLRVGGMAGEVVRLRVDQQLRRAHRGGRLADAGRDQLQLAGKTGDVA